MNFLLGTIFGIIVSTVGFQGLARWADSGVDKVRQVTREAAQ
jgi:hypothetical protein